MPFLCNKLITISERIQCLYQCRFCKLSRWSQNGCTNAFSARLYPKHLAIEEHKQFIKNIQSSISQIKDRLFHFSLEAGTKNGIAVNNPFQECITMSALLEMFNLGWWFSQSGAGIGWTMARYPRLIYERVIKRRTAVSAYVSTHMCLCPIRNST